MEQLQIAKADVGASYNLETGNIVYNLRFKFKGQHRFNGICFEFFETKEEADQALNRFNEKVDTYEATKRHGKYFIMQKTIQEQNIHI